MFNVYFSLFLHIYSRLLLLLHISRHILLYPASSSPESWLCGLPVEASHVNPTFYCMPGLGNWIRLRLVAEFNANNRNCQIRYMRKFTDYSGIFYFLFLLFILLRKKKKIFFSLSFNVRFIWLLWFTCSIFTLFRCCLLRELRDLLNFPCGFLASPRKTPHTL